MMDNLRLNIRVRSKKGCSNQGVIYRLAIKDVFICVSFCLLSACCIAPEPFCTEESYVEAQKEIQQVFAQQEPLCEELDFNQAMARGLRYNLDNRAKQTNIAIQAGQMEIAEFSMLPVLGLSGSLYTRDNDNATFGSNANGTPSDVIAFGADKTIRTGRTGIKWNLIDFGMGYVKTKETGDRLLIAEEESRQQLQKLIQDVRVGYWLAYNSQQISCELKQYQKILDSTMLQIRKAVADKVVPKEEILRYEGLLLEGSRRLYQYAEKLKKSEIAFRYLINLPVNQNVVLKKPSCSLVKVQNLRNLNFEKLDAITLVNRPELRSQKYQRRIAELGTKTAIFQALPVITLNSGRNFDSNSFLVHNYWNDAQIEVSWNVFNIAALPVSLRNVKTQTKYESLKLMALTLGALNETRVAFAHYQSLAKEARISQNQILNSTQLYKMRRDREKASLGSMQQTNLAYLYLLIARIDQILLLSDLASALGQLYLAAGFDLLPLEVVNASPSEILCYIENNLLLQENMGFKEYVNATYDKLFCSNVTEKVIYAN